MGEFFFLFLLGLAAFGSAESVVFADNTPSSFSIGDLTSNPAAVLGQGLVSTTVKSLGIVFDHRPMEPASPLGTHLGLDLGIDVEAVQLPPSFAQAFTDAGLNFPAIPFLVNAREINLHKGISETVDIGGSYFAFLGYFIWSVDLKVVIFHPEEGLICALRLGRSSVHIPLATAQAGPATYALAVDTITWTPTILFSKRLDFAEPYFGLGYQSVTGGISLTQTSDLPLPELEPITGGGGSFLAFLGLSLKAPVLGLRLTLEGGYSLDGYNTIGTKIGFNF